MKKMNNFLIENELGYTNHSNGKYVTEEKATHIATIEDGKTVIIVYEKEYLDGLDLDKLVNPVER